MPLAPAADVSVTDRTHSTAATRELRVLKQWILSVWSIGLALVTGCVANTSPTANAGSLISITLPQNRTELVGSGSDLDGAVLGYAWTLKSAPSGDRSALRNATSARAMAVALVEGTYVFTLTVTDDRGQESAGSDVTVTVNADPLAPDTEVDLIHAQPAPVFRAGHRLPPLTFGVYPHLAFNKAIAEKYGFALHLGAPTSYYAEQATSWTADVKAIGELNAADPERYPISMALTGYDFIYDCCRAERVRLAHPDIALHHSDGSVRRNNAKTTCSDNTVQSCFDYSPIASADAWSALMSDSGITGTSGYLAQIDGALQEHGAKLAVINATGEWGVGIAEIGPYPSSGVLGEWPIPYWDDPAVAAAWGPLPDRSNFGRAIVEAAYAGVSTGKAVAEGTIAQLLVSSVTSNPNVLYTYYLGGPSFDTGRYNEWALEAWDPKKLRDSHVNHWIEPSRPDDVYSTQVYYGYIGQGGLGAKWPGRNADHFTSLLAVAANGIAAGAPHGYVWFNPKESHAPDWVDPVELMGFLKASYALTMVGGPFFYFISYAETNPDDPHGQGIHAMPDWMPSMIALGEVHALYSHFDDFLLDGDVVMNAHGDSHPFQHWNDPFPLYEQYAYDVGAPFEGRERRDATVRVVLRKRRGADDWLLAGWSTGDDKTVDVELPPPLGRLTVQMRKAGNVYRITLDGTAPVVTLVDVDALHPTDRMLPSD